MGKSVRKIVFSAVIAAIYAALTILLAPISYGPIQFRISEAMCVLPFFFPFSAWGLFVGCLIANVFGNYGMIDILFGAFATLLSGLITARIGAKLRHKNVGVCVLGCFPPVLVNGIVVGMVISICSTPDAFWSGFVLFGMQIAAGEAVVMYLLGLPLLLFFPQKLLAKMHSMYNVK